MNGMSRSPELRWPIGEQPYRFELLDKHIRRVLNAACRRNAGRIIGVEIADNSDSDYHRRINLIRYGHDRVVRGIAGYRDHHRVSSWVELRHIDIGLIQPNAKRR